MNSTKTLLLSAGGAVGILSLLRLNRQLSLSPVSWTRVWRRALAEWKGEPVARQLMARL